MEGGREVGSLLEIGARMCGRVFSVRCCVVVRWVGTVM